ncbi:MAG TPA: hypothetical protein VFE22_15870 [Edaphobacter sp.]|nr:hypothetical protein [Edaphobacter sp.]
MHCIYNGNVVFEWDQNNLRKIRAHRIKPAEVEAALSNSPMLIYEQDVQGEVRYVYYGRHRAEDSLPLFSWSATTVFV